MTILRFTMFVTTILLVLVFSALNTVVVFADEENPPLDNPTEVIPPIVEGNISTETETPNQNMDIDSLPITEGDEETNNTSSEITSEPVSLPDLLSEMPAGTNVIITNLEGEIVPLATEEAERIMVINDPIWCPVGVAPNPNNPACSDSAFTLYELVNLTPGEPYTSGIIWIQAGYDLGQNTLIDDSWGTNSENYNLTLQGGWNGIYGSTALDPIDPYSYFDTKIEIINWIGNITINNIVIDTNPTFSVSPANDDYALYVETAGAITLNNVTIMNNENTNAGGYVRGGAYLDSGGNTTINNSNFNNNEGSGLVIETTGNVVTNNISAINNGQTGVYIDNSFASTAKPVTMKGLKQFIGNGLSGLFIHSNGTVTLSNLVATDNGNYGVYVNNTWGMYLSKPVYSNVSISGSNLFNYNVNDGLSVLSLGIISVSNITAIGNQGDGASLNNCFFGGAYDCLSKSPKPITVSGVNILNDNQGRGLNVNSAGGKISLSSVTASYNNLHGLYADNRWQNYFGNRITGTWTLTGYGVFNQNGLTGVMGWSYGPMTLNNVTANGNGEEGGYLRVLNTFTLNGYGTFNNNGTASIVFVNGLHVQASSTTTLNNITANNNNGHGAYIYAWRSGSLGANVNLKGTNVFNNNGGTNHIYDGLHIETDGLITLSNISANYNAQHGAELCNHTDTTINYLCGIDVNSSFLIGDTTQGVILTGVNSFNNNWENGLVVQSNGAIQINNLTADHNGQSGVSGSGGILDNYQGSSITVTPQIVTLTGFVNVNYNYDQGLRIESIGAVTLSNIIATNNIIGSGVYIDNGWISSKQSNVTVTGLNNQFNANGGNGLYIYSYGSITISNITASWNNSNGVYLYNSAGIYVKPIVVSGTNNFNWNYYDGLYINSNGAVTLNRINATYNDRNSGDSYNASGVFVSANGAITLTCGFTYGNYNYGIYLNSLIKVTIKGWYSYGNGTNYSFSSPNINTRICLLP